MAHSSKLLVPIITTFLVGLGVAAAYPLVGVGIFFAGSYATLAYALWREKHPRAALPAATVVHDDHDSGTLPK